MRTNRVNNQFYRKLRLGRSFRDAISHFLFIKKRLMAENETTKQQENKDKNND